MATAATGATGVAAVAPAAFADVDTRAAPIVVVRFRRADPEPAEAKAYFAALADVLNAASPDARIGLVFDASAINVGDTLTTAGFAFFKQHGRFTGAYTERMKAVCFGFGIVVKSAALGVLVKGAVALAGTADLCVQATTEAEAVAALTALGGVGGVGARR